MSLAMPTRAPEVATGVTRLPIVFVNTYFVTGLDGWVLVDTGLPGSSGYIRQAAEARFGEGSPPPAPSSSRMGTSTTLARHSSLLDSGTCPFMPTGSSCPYLTGRSDYPPKDPTMGGAIAFMARAFPDSGYDFGERVRELPTEGSVPGLPEWRWLHTPGHSPGHVSFWRESDQTLIAGDAFATMDLDSWTSQVTHARELSRPPAPFTPDWGAARRSVEMLAGLGARTLAAGHGRAVSDNAAARLTHFAQSFSPPEQGRYVGHPRSCRRERRGGGAAARARPLAQTASRGRPAGFGGGGFFTTLDSATADDATTLSDADR